MLRFLRPSWRMICGALVLGICFGSAIALETDTLDAPYAEARRTVRTSLDLEKRWMVLPTSEDAQGRMTVPCPKPEEALVLVTGGQSNAANANSAPSRLPTTAPVAIWFDGTCYQAADPVLGATGTQGSLWPKLGAAVAAQRDQPVLLINGAVGGTQASDWLDRRSGYYAALKARVQSAVEAGFTPDLILWHQGETDAAVARDAAEVIAPFQALTDRLLADMPDAGLYLFQTSKCIGARRAKGVDFVRAAQRAVAAQNDRIIQGMNTDRFGNDYRWDTCHFNSMGRDAIIAELAPVLVDVLR